MNFDHIVTEAAYALATHEPGPASGFGNSEEEHLLVDYAPVLLHNIGEHEIAARLAAATNSMAGTAWITVSETEGQVRMRMAALDSHADEVIRKFEAAAQAYEDTGSF